MQTAFTPLDRHLSSVVIVAVVHYLCCWATGFETITFVETIHSVLVMPLFPLVAYLPMWDATPFYLLMATNSLLWGLAVDFVVCGVLRLTKA